MYMYHSLLFLLLLPSSSLLLDTQLPESAMPIYAFVVALLCILACFFYKMCFRKISSQGDLFPCRLESQLLFLSLHTNVPAVWPVSWVIFVTCSGFWDQHQLFTGSSAAWITSRVVSLDFLCFYLIEHGLRWMWEEGMEAPHLQLFHYFCTYFSPT